MGRGLTFLWLLWGWDNQTLTLPLPPRARKVPGQTKAHQLWGQRNRRQTSHGKGKNSSPSHHRSTTMASRPIITTPTGQHLTTGGTGPERHNSHLEGGQQGPQVCKTTCRCWPRISASRWQARLNIPGILWCRLCQPTWQHKPRRLPSGHHTQGCHHRQTRTVCPGWLAELKAPQSSQKLTQCRSTSSVRNSRHFDVWHHLLAVDLAPRLTNQRHSSMPIDTSTVSRNWRKRAIRPAHKTRTTAQQWGRQTHLHRSASRPRQTQMCRGPDKMC